MIARSLDPRLHKPVVVGLQAFFNPQSALASQARCRAQACVGVEIEPMFSVEAKKRYDETVGRPSKQSVADLRPIKRAKASDPAADVCGVSPNGLQTACPPY